MSILHNILLRKKEEVLDTSKRVPLDILKQKTRSLPILDFRKTLNFPGLSVIAEIKRKSPSYGIIKPNTNPVQIAREYSDNGAAAISVLTDEKYFGGTIKDLQLVKEAVSIPILRKDFIMSEYQVYESYLAGADAILLIAEVLQPDTLFSLYDKAIELGIGVLIEVHSISILKQIEKLKLQMIGVNARNLTNMKTDLSRCEKIFPQLPPDCLKVAESGISSLDDLRFIKKIGFDAALVGTFLMKSESPGISLKNMLAGLEL